MTGGVLMCGSYNNFSYNFAVLNNVSAFFSFSGVEFMYIGRMDSVVSVLGGTVCFEDVTMNSQNDDQWMNPLISIEYMLAVTVHFLSTNITNSCFRHASSSPYVYKSAIIYITNTSYHSVAVIITLNISASFFQNNSFYLCGIDDARGGVSRFQGQGASCFF
jgi:hypothetical protein